LIGKLRSDQMRIAEPRDAPAGGDAAALNVFRLQRRALRSSENDPETAAALAEDALAAARALAGDEDELVVPALASAARAAIRHWLSGEFCTRAGSRGIDRGTAPIATWSSPSLAASWPRESPARWPPDDPSATLVGMAQVGWSRAYPVEYHPFMPQCFLWERGSPVCTVENAEWTKIYGTTKPREVSFAVAFGTAFDANLDEHELGTATAKVRIHFVSLDIRDSREISVLAHGE
jgi:hypothetical protein